MAVYMECLGDILEEGNDETLKSKGWKWNECGELTSCEFTLQSSLEFPESCGCHAVSFHDDFRECSNDGETERFQKPLTQSTAG